MNAINVNVSTLNSIIYSLFIYNKNDEENVFNTTKCFSFERNFKTSKQKEKRTF